MAREAPIRRSLSRDPTDENKALWTQNRFPFISVCFEVCVLPQLNCVVTENEHSMRSEVTVRRLSSEVRGTCFQWVTCELGPETWGWGVRTNSKSLSNRGQHRSKGLKVGTGLGGWGFRQR